jgi:HAD superfamily hydrolase (TIGR01509 family)
MHSVFDWKPAAVVFDCDGLLMDTESCWTVAETAVFARRGLGYGPEHKALLIGKSVPAAGIVLAQLFNEPGSAATLAEELLQLVENIIAEHAEPLPGATEIVCALNGVLPLAVASNSPRRLLDIALSRGGFSDLLPLTIAADEVEAPKPAPELYVRACEMLSVEPQTAVAFEDSVTGASSARAAGLKVVGVPSLANVTLPADILFASLLDSKLQAWVGDWRDKALALRR